jgi:hypothetical protein
VLGAIATSEKAGRKLRPANIELQDISDASACLALLLSGTTDADITILTQVATRCKEMTFLLYNGDNE